MKGILKCRGYGITDHLADSAPADQSGNGKPVSYTHLDVYKRQLQFFGIVAKGENRVINEFENGKIYMIETNRAIDFIGEVTILAEMPRTSVTIEAVTECTVIYVSRKDAETWIRNDQHILRLMARRTAFKLYRSSYNNGLKLYYPPTFLLADYLVRAYEGSLSEQTDAVFPENGAFILQKIRERLSEELGMNIKTLDRTIRSMQKNGYFNLTKGKISFGYEELSLIHI